MHVDHIKTRSRQTEPSPEDRLDNLRSNKNGDPIIDFKKLHPDRPHRFRPLGAAPIGLVIREPHNVCSRRSRVSPSWPRRPLHAMINYLI